METKSFLLTVKNSLRNCGKWEWTYDPVWIVSSHGSDSFMGPLRRKIQWKLISAHVAENVTMIPSMSSRHPVKSLWRLNPVGILTLRKKQKRPS
jgi:hypothetical protein